jgi:hypothetical protein
VFPLLVGVFTSDAVDDGSPREGESSGNEGVPLNGFCEPSGLEFGEVKGESAVGERFT